MTEEMTMDSVLDEVGHFGPYQARLCLLVLAPILTSAMFNAQYVFAALDPDYRCLVPECEARPPRWEAGEWGAWALPPEPESRCQRLAPLGSGCRRESFSTKLQACDSWIYRNNDSIVSEFELACNPWKRTMVGTVHSLGVFTALLFVGVFSDSFGRRFTFIMTASMPSVVGLARSWAPSYGWYLVLEYVSATVGAGVYGTGFVLVMEMLGARRRVMGGSLLSITYALGEALLALISWAVPYWRTRTLLLYGPTILFLTYYLCLDESLRWLLSKGKKTQAILLMQKIAAQNGKTLQLAKVERLAGALDGPAGAPPAGGRAVLGEVLRSRRLRARVLVCSYCWITCTFVYYGLSINSVSLAGNLYANYALTALVELPGVVLSVSLLDRFGRRRTIMAALLLCGTALIAFSCIPNKRGGLGAGLALLGKMTVSLATSSNYIHASEMFPTPARHSLLGVCALVSRIGMAVATLSPLLAVGASLALTLAGKACVSLAFVSLYVFTTELFPTSARHSLLNLCSFVGRLGAIAAPLSPLLADVREWLPYLVFGCLALTAALLLLLTPETLHTRLPDTVQDAEQLARAPRPSAPALAEPPAAAADQTSDKR